MQSLHVGDSFSFNFTEKIEKYLCNEPSPLESESVWFAESSPFSGIENDKWLYRDASNRHFWVSSLALLNRRLQRSMLISTMHLCQVPNHESSVITRYIIGSAKVCRMGWGTGTCQFSTGCSYQLHLLSRHTAHSIVPKKHFPTNLKWWSHTDGTTVCLLYTSPSPRD